MRRAIGDAVISTKHANFIENRGDASTRDVVELMGYFRGHGGRVRAIPGEGLGIPLWILGSSLYGAQLAAALGLPFAFASHFAPQQLMQALEVYRGNFKPSAQLAKPYVMLGFNVFVADTDAEAEFRASSWQQAFVNLRSGRPGRLPPPGDHGVSEYSRKARSTAGGRSGAGKYESANTLERRDCQNVSAYSSGGLRCVLQR